MAMTTRMMNSAVQGNPGEAPAWEVDTGPALGTYSILRDGALHTRLGGTSRQARIRTQRLSDAAPSHYWSCIDEIGGVVMTAGAAG